MTANRKTENAISVAYENIITCFPYEAPALPAQVCLGTIQRFDMLTFVA